MNREIKFKGKSLTTSEWLYGSLFNDGAEDYILPNLPGAVLDYEDYQVDSNTVGQFTGLKDKNGKDIFEGDVVERKDSAFGFSHVGVVKFDSSLGAFVLEYEKYGMTCQCTFDKGFSENDGMCTIDGTFSYEVIGNIYDNKELIKE